MALLIYGYKKSGGHVLTHLLSGSGKTLAEINGNNKPLAVICSNISARDRMYTYILRRECSLSFHPSA